MAITVSSKLSGTYQSAMIAAKNFAGKVFVVDSMSVAVGSGILAEHAVNLAAYGASAPEIADMLKNANVIPRGVPRNDIFIISNSSVGAVDFERMPGPARQASARLINAPQGS